jgi:hypothetical protein
MKRQKSQALLQSNQQQRNSIVKKHQCVVIAGSATSFSTK